MVESPTPTGAPAGQPLRVFVNAPGVLDAPAADLIQQLRLAGAEVEHSPFGGDDPRHKDWYDDGLPAAVARCDAFVIVPVTWWDSSTWMAIEAEAGFLRGLGEPGFPLYAWSPDGVELERIARGLRPYVRAAEVLPRDVRAAAAAVVSAGKGPPPVSDLFRAPVIFQPDLIAHGNQWVRYCGAGTVRNQSVEYVVVAIEPGIVDYPDLVVGRGRNHYFARADAFKRAKELIDANTAARAQRANPGVEPPG